MGPGEYSVCGGQKDAIGESPANFIVLCSKLTQRIVLLRIPLLVPEDSTPGVRFQGSFLRVRVEPRYKVIGMPQSHRRLGEWNTEITSLTESQH